MNKAIGMVAGLVLLLGMTSTAGAATEGPGGCSFPGMTCQTSVTFAPPAAAPAAPANPSGDSRCFTEEGHAVCNLEYSFVGERQVVATCQSVSGYGDPMDTLVRWGVFRSTIAEYDAGGTRTSYVSHEEAEYGGVVEVVGPCTKAAAPVPAAPAVPDPPVPVVTPATTTTPVGDATPAETMAAPEPAAAPAATVEAAGAAPATPAVVRLTPGEARSAATAALRRRYGKRDLGLSCSVQSSRRATCTTRVGRSRITVSVARADAQATSVTVRSKPVR